VECTPLGETSRRRGPIRCSSGRGIRARWAATFPAIMILITALTFNLLGDGWGSRTLRRICAFASRRTDRIGAVKREGFPVGLSIRVTRRASIDLPDSPTTASLPRAASARQMPDSAADPGLGCACALRSVGTA
jgi:hypothetical protein